MIDFGT